MHASLPTVSRHCACHSLRQDIDWHWLCYSVKNNACLCKVHCPLIQFLHSHFNLSQFIIINPAAAKWVRLNSGLPDKTLDKHSNTFMCMRRSLNWCGKLPLSDLLASSALRAYSHPCAPKGHRATSRANRIWAAVGTACPSWPAVTAPGRPLNLNSHTWPYENLILHGVWDPPTARLCHCSGPLWIRLNYFLAHCLQMHKSCTPTPMNCQEHVILPAMGNAHASGSDSSHTCSDCNSEPLL